MRDQGKPLINKSMLAGQAVDEREKAVQSPKDRSLDKNLAKNMGNMGLGK